MPAFLRAQNSFFAADNFAECSGERILPVKALLIFSRTSGRFYGLLLPV